MHDGRFESRIRRECTDHIVVWNERHLRKVLEEYCRYYNQDRTHLGLEKETPIDGETSKKESISDELVELPKVGDLHHRYEWHEAA